MTASPLELIELGVLLFFLLCVGVYALGDWADKAIANHRRRTTDERRRP